MTHESANATISAPASWRRVDNQQLIDQITASSLSANTAYTDTIGFFQLNALEFYLVESDLNATLALMPLQFESRPSLIDIASTMTTFYADMGIEVVSADFASLPVGSALRLMVNLSVNQLDGTALETTQLQYIIYPPTGQGYILTISVPEDTFEANVDLIETITATLTLNDIQSTWRNYSSFELMIQAPFDWSIRAPDTTQNEQIALGVTDTPLQASFAVTIFDGLLDPDVLIIQMSADYEAQGGTVLAVETLDLPIGQARRIHGTSTQLNEANEDIAIEQYIYVIFAESLITATFTSDEEQFESVAPVFTRIMATLNTIN